MPDTLDPATSAAIAALAVAAVALLIATAQVLQQYFITGQLIRLCDSVVFGVLPGKGRRIWEASQFRFRVVYSIPQVGIADDLWPADVARSFSDLDESLPNVSKDLGEDSGDFPGELRARRWLLRRLWRRDDSEDGSSMDRLAARRRRRKRYESRYVEKRQGLALRVLRRLANSSWASRSKSVFAPAATCLGVLLWLICHFRKMPKTPKTHSSKNTTGEAAWVSFIRNVHYACGESMGYDVAEGDADRCPQDLPSVPMQVSLREIIIMAFMTGMDCTNSSFTDGTVTMQGAAGTITSSQHPVLGPMVHFKPRSTEKLHGICANGKISEPWIYRTFGNCNVAGRSYDWPGRRRVETHTGFWVKHLRTAGNKDIVPNEIGKQTNRKKVVNEDDENDRKTDAMLPPGPEMKATIQRRGVHDGDWQLVNQRAHRRFYRRDSESLADAEPVVIRRSRDRPEAIVIVRDDWSELEVKRKWHQRLKYKLRTWGWRQEATSSATSSTQSSSTGTIIDRWGHAPRRGPMPPGVPVPIPMGRPMPLRRPTPMDRPMPMEIHVPMGGPMPMGVPMHFESRPTRERAPFQATVEDEEISPSKISLPASISTGSEMSFGESHSDIGNTDFPPDFLPTRSRNLRPPRNHFRVERINGLLPDGMEERRRVAHQRQAERSIKAAENERDRKIVEELQEQGRVPPKPGVLLLTWKHEDRPRDWSKGKHRASDDKASDKSNHSAISDDEEEKITQAEREALHREDKRKKEREERDRKRQERGDAYAKNTSQFGQMNWHWLSQTDIIPGFWATPWKGLEFLDSRVCLGGIMVIIEALMGFTDQTSLLYLDLEQNKDILRETIEWMLEGRQTWPGYAHNARGGVVCSGQYLAVKLSAFKEPIPAIELLTSYDYQVASFHARDQAAVERSLIELIHLDAWLSLVCRTDEIQNGRNGLTKQAPALVQVLMEEFAYDFSNLELSDSEGGMQENQELAANVMDFLLDDELSDAEQLYALMATLRALKVAQAVLQGCDTHRVQDILRNDVQVYLV